MHGSYFDKYGSLCVWFIRFTSSLCAGIDKPPRLTTCIGLVGCSMSIVIASYYIFIVALDC